ncbi:hypothetical protein GCM10007079_47270 [Nocardiopsis terrae]|uniref:Glycosyltransferase involved in cell wall biosynthesis n=1 Tax=Nocardiopsis terrae TaxID=372655 RepID=A0ABR9HKA8_9ACTN|nr:glycosyltransferase [Nocardiopsis terrae]MBE1459462.1 glycosyltransferase involved in cell wall biosynthesis [Nocardiopsis terrae]GHC95508.1 hypothetical protein GCM10007079_47270 [Nocardiopsis terrae]
MQLVLAGAGQRAGEPRALAAELGVAERVFFLGFVSDEDMPLVYAAADVFAIAGVAELRSIATLEAMSTGLPVVAADAMALPHLVGEGCDGFLFPAGEPVRLAGRRLAVLGPERYRNVSGRGRGARSGARSPPFTGALRGGLPPAPGRWRGPLGGRTRHGQHTWCAWLAWCA